MKTKRFILQLLTCVVLFQLTINGPAFPACAAACAAGCAVSLIFYSGCMTACLVGCVGTCFQPDQPI
jgi:hypothetical protein